MILGAVELKLEEIEEDLWASFVVGIAGGFDNRGIVGNWAGERWLEDRDTCRCCDNIDACYY